MFAEIKKRVLCIVVEVAFFLSCPLPFHGTASTNEAFQRVCLVYRVYLLYMCLSFSLSLVKCTSWYDVDG